MSQPCPYCGNLIFEEEDGVLVCTSCGRQQEGGLQVADDDAEFGTRGKIARRKVEKTKAKVSKIYRGAKAYKLYLQAWQHIMWRQSYELIHGPAKAPPELWIVARDLWTVKLSSLLQQFDDKAKDKSEADSTSHVEHDPSSENESEPARGRTRHSSHPKLWDTISLVYLAAMLIRHPMSLSKVYNYIRTEEVPFIRAMRFVPYEMTSHLPSEYQLALDTISIPKPEELQKSALRLVQSFATDFGMQIPPLNWRVLLYEWIIELGLPLEIYECVKDLATLLNYDFTYQVPIQKQSDLNCDAPTRKIRRTPIAMPELALMSLIIVAAKLLFPFTDMPSHESVTEGLNDSIYVSLTNLIVDWPTWLSIHKAYVNPPNGPAKHIETTDRDVSEMSPEDIDEYMSWYQRTFTTPDSILRQKKTDLEMSILDMFPLPELPHTQSTGRPSPSLPQDLQSQSLSQSAATTTAQTRCAAIQSRALRYEPSPKQQSYMIIPTLDALSATNELFDGNEGETNNPILYFHELAARTACTDLKSLFTALRYTENKLEGWIRERRRAEIFGEE